MLTPVAEAGHVARALADRVRTVLHTIGEPELARLMEAIEGEARVARVVYLHDDIVEPVRIMATPMVALPDQLSYARTVTLTLHRALKRLPDLYFADSDVRRVLELPAIEEAWLREYWTPAARASNTVFGRHDAVCDFGSADWKQSLWFLEPNMSGIGGLHLAPSASRVLARTMLPVLHRMDPELQLETSQDVRGLLMQELIDHLESIGRRGQTICFVEPKYSGSGPDEQVELARYVHDHFGYTVCHADPSELELDGGEVRHQDRVIDLAYRDYGVIDLLEVAAEGVDIAPMRALFAQNRLVSSIAAELDQKSCFEVLTDPELLDRHFDSDERRLFRRHIPWTRVLGDRTTTLPESRTGELLPFVWSARERLVIKPNRSYGGTGVLVGAETKPAAWAAAIEGALRDPERWVVQLAVPLTVMEFPSFDDTGRLQREPYYIVLGFTPSTYGMATVGRASQQRVVNVAQHGGICVVVIGHAPGRLVV
jgi:hypothetical protein